MAKYLACLMTKSTLLANTTVKASIACQNDSQLDADAVEPKTMAVARLYRSSAKKPNAPVRSAWILANQKHALMSARAIKIAVVG